MGIGVGGRFGLSVAAVDSPEEAGTRRPCWGPPLQTLWPTHSLDVPGSAQSRKRDEGQEHNSAASMSPSEIDSKAKPLRVTVFHDRAHKRLRVLEGKGGPGCMTMSYCH